MVEPDPNDSQRIDTGGGTHIDGNVHVQDGDFIGRDKIINYFQQIQQRALTKSEEAKQAHEIETQYLALGIKELAEQLQAQVKAGVEGEPFKGLVAYDLGDSDIFFGRSAAIETLLNRLEAGPLTILHAESGAGKTSLLQAGIQPRLVSVGHLAVCLRPYKANPDSVIRQAFLTAPAQAPNLASAPLREFLRQVSGILDPSTKVYLFLDQFEEFFNFLSREERQPFIQSLSECLRDPSLNVRWVLALRAEAFSFLAELEDYGIAPFQNAFRLNRMTREEALEAIREPANQRSIKFETGLPEAILEGLQAEQREINPAQLQIVCFAMLENVSKSGELTLKNYQALGEAQGILGNYLRNQVDSFPDSERDLAWKVLRALITWDVKRAIRTQGELTKELRGPSQKSMRIVLDRLVARRLVVLGKIEGDTSYELAHDYLAEEIELDPHEKARKAAQELLAQELRAYHQTGSLIAKERLEAILTFREELVVSHEAQDLLTKSQEEVKRQAAEDEAQRQRELDQAKQLAKARGLGLVFLATGLVVAIGLFLFAMNKSKEAGDNLNTANIANTQSAANASTAQAASTQAVGNLAKAEAAKSTAEAEKNRAEAAEQISRAQLRAAQGRLEFEENPLLGLALAVEGWSLVPKENIESKGIVEKALRDISKYGRIEKLGSDIQQIFISSDQKRLLVDHGTKPGELLSLPDGQHLKTLSYEVKDAVFGPGSASKYFVVYYSKEKSPELRLTPNGEIVPLSGEIEKIYFSSGDSSTYFVVDYLDRPGEIRLSLNAKVIHTFSDKIDNNVRFSPDPEASYVWVNFAEGANAPGEVWHISGSEYSLFDSRVKNLIFSEDVYWPYFIVQHNDTLTPTLYLMDDGSPVLKLDDGLVEGIYHSPDISVRYFIVDYAESQKGELYHLDESDQIRNEILPDAIETVYFSPDPAAPYFWVDYVNMSGELRYTSNGEVVDLSGEVKPNGKIENIYFFPDDFAVFVVDYVDPIYSSEYRFISDGEIVPEGRKIENICRSPDGSAVFVVDYKDEPGEFWRISDGKVERHQLHDKIKYIGPRIYSDPKTPYRLIAYQSDPGVVCRGDEFEPVKTTPVLSKKVESGRIYSTLSATYFWITYPDKQREIWYAGDNFVRLVVLDSPVKDYKFIETSDRLLVLFSDQRSYLLDLIWLRGMAGKAASLAGEDLARLACVGPLTLKPLYEAKLVADYSDFSEPVACP